MESNDVRHSLTDVERLRAATSAETHWAPRWAVPVMVVGIIAFIAVCAVASQTVIRWASIGWVGFVGVWLYATRRDQQARPLPEHSPRGALALTGGLWIVLIAAAAIPDHRPWLLIGVANLLWGAAMGLFAWRQAHHANT
ncbi:MAG: hypothetical protein QOF20_1191 [Acidimicrobiaceae bacterium]|jgi:hypothetical protein|nr:hypothetical protein [Acidimicrobiaceae bacterium]MDQ1365569.1 hypothetical protein [Acidimicrobiaceae bacterium]MDQ1368838.1 hypothetical protein [Acidimicrobiaceae bacterium]MDQ1416620.1 hypothetical protein [Acidimicrobiaceae bacterium]